MIIKTLPVKLTHEEEHRKGKAAAALTRECTQIHLEIAQLKLRIKEQQDVIQQKQTAIAGLHHEIDTGQEYRDVQCQEEQDHERLVVHTVRLDTLEVIETRAMTLDERQVTLPFAVRER